MPGKQYLADQFVKLSNTPDVYRFFICFKPLLYQTENAGSERDGRNKRLFTKRHEDEASTNSKRLLNCVQIFSVFRRT